MKRALLLAFLTGSIEEVVGQTPISELNVEILSVHNAVRSAVTDSVTPLGPLKLNFHLMKAANSSASACRMGLDTPAARTNIAGYGYVGESRQWFSANAAAAGTVEGARAVVNGWAAEGLGYNVQVNACDLDSGCYRYIQMVAAGTTDIGCAYTQCPSGTPAQGQVYVCFYGPGANTLLRPYTPKNALSRMPPLSPGDIWVTAQAKWIYTPAAFLAAMVGLICCVYQRLRCAANRSLRTTMA